MEERLTELESRVAFQDDTIQKLNDVIVAQQGQLDTFAVELKALAEQVSAITSQMIESSTLESPPPHY